MDEESASQTESQHAAEGLAGSQVALHAGMLQPGSSQLWFDMSSLQRVGHDWQSFWPAPV